MICRRRRESNRARCLAVESGVLVVVRDRKVVREIADTIIFFFFCLFGFSLGLKTSFT